MRANFEFITKLGVEWWCFHDRDITPDGKTLEETNATLDDVVALAKELQGIKIRPLWGYFLIVSPSSLHARSCYEGYSLSWRTKLCFLGWKGRISISLKHRYEKGVGSYDNFS
ncbi:xylose isomerase-like [Aristolochia californica]|uniref:xylose isomerase-like n=1 Tax=Aristolochia californica TaxID=171875 RepID=UPI0035D789AD